MSGGAVVFLHVPKTGGTSLAQALAAQYAPDQVLAGPGGNLSAEFVAASADRLDDEVFLHGHGGHGVMQALGGRGRVVTLLRNPADHAVSNYLHVLDARHNPYTPYAERLGFSGFMRFERMLVFQTVSLAGPLTPAPPLNLADVEARVSLVLDFLDTAFFVGVLERRDEAAQGLSQLLGLPRPLAFPHVNAAEHRNVRPGEKARLLAEYEALRREPQFAYQIALEEAVYRKACAVMDRRMAALADGAAAVT